MDAEARFNEYIERFSKCNHITPDEAVKNAIVKEVKLYYEEEVEIS